MAGCGSYVLLLQQRGSSNSAHALELSTISTGHPSTGVHVGSPKCGSTNSRWPRSEGLSLNSCEPGGIALEMSVSS